MNQSHVARVIRAALAVCAALVLCAPAAHAQKALYTAPSLTPEAALRIAQAALGACARQGAQVAVAVSDRAGNPLVVLRDRFAGPHTTDVAVNKAWTALTFKIDTLELVRVTQPGQDAAGLRHVPRVTAIGGGRMVQAAGSLVGAVGVSGAPSGPADDVCAKAGIAAVADDLEL